MNEKTKAAVEAAIELVKGWTRPLVFMVMSGVVCWMTAEQLLNSVPWQFWAVYSAVGGSWLGEGTVNLISKVKNK